MASLRIAKESLAIVVSPEFLPSRKKLDAGSFRPEEDDMSGRYNRRNPAVVELSDEHAAIVGALAHVHYCAPRKEVIAALIDRVLPEVLAEVERDDPEKLKQIEYWKGIFAGHIEKKPQPQTTGKSREPRAGVIDLGERREARRRKRAKNRM